LKTDHALKSIPVIMSTAVGATTFYHYLNMLNLQLADPIPQPDGYMEKPLDPQRLLQLIQRLIQRCEAI
jgi:two-component system, OmpR family, phosphate regulon response regulator PhoB